MKGKFRIVLARPAITPEAKENVDRVFSENFFSQGFFNAEFEEMFAKHHGVSYATTCSNGTAALLMALKAAGVGAGDEVIVPTLTFSATAGAVVAAGAVPVFADSLPSDGTMSPDSVASAITDRTKAIISVDLYGLPADYAGLRRVMEGKNIILIQDAAEGLGGTYERAPIGIQGDISCFSFFGNKIITTGEGGMCLTDRKDFYDAMVLYKNHGTGARAYWVEVPGFNLRMTNLQAAIGVSQMHALPDFLAARYEIFETYLSELAGMPSVQALPFTDRNYAPWLFTAHVPGVPKEETVAFLAEQGIESRPGFFPLHRTPAYAPFVKEGQEFPDADAFSSDLINLPTYIGLAKEEIQDVISALGKMRA